MLRHCGRFPSPKPTWNFGSPSGTQKPPADLEKPNSKKSMDFVDDLNPNESADCPGVSGIINNI